MEWEFNPIRPLCKNRQKDQPEKYFNLDESFILRLKRNERGYKDKFKWIYAVECVDYVNGLYNSDQDEFLWGGSFRQSNGSDHKNGAEK